MQLPIFSILKIEVYMCMPVFGGFEKIVRLVLRDARPEAKMCKIKISYMY